MTEKKDQKVWAHLGWHMHQEHSSNGSLSLTITLFGTMQRISLQHAEQVLLPECSHINKWYSETTFSHIDTTTGIIRKAVLTHDLLSLQTFHGRGTVDAGPSQWYLSIWDLLADWSAPEIIIIHFKTATFISAEVEAQCSNTQQSHTWNLPWFCSLFTLPPVR